MLRIALWLLLHASITLLVLRYQIPKIFFLALLAAVLFVGGMRAAEGGGPRFFTRVS